MSHEPPIPEAARSPYPLQPAPIADREAAAPVQARNDDDHEPAPDAVRPLDEESWIDRARETAGRVRESVGRVSKSKVALGAAVGVGSAAVLAAVILARRGGSDEPPKQSTKSRQNGAAKAKPRSKAQTSKRELVEPTPGDKRFVRRKADGTFGKTVDVGKSLAADRRSKAKAVAKSGQGDRGDQKD
jgi:hypothetical protein